MAEAVLMTVTPAVETPKRAPRKREYPRGESPFCSPQPGDMLKSAAVPLTRPSLSFPCKRSAIRVALALAGPNTGSCS
jgi:hypothetical protein